MQGITEDVLLASVKHRQKLHTTLNADSYGKDPVHVASNDSWPLNNDPVLASLGRQSTLTRELLTRYGSQAQQVALQNYKTGSDAPEEDGPRLIEQILNRRTKEHSERQRGNNHSLNALVAERERLLAAEDQTLQRRRQMVAPPSYTATTPGGSGSGIPLWGSEDSSVTSNDRPDVVHGVHGVESFIDLMRDRLPADIARYKKLKEQTDRDYVRLYRPYLGELGPQSYQPWQMPDYHMARSIVDEVVDKFLDSFFRHLPPAINKDTAQAVLAADTRRWQKERDALTETRVVQLLMEEILLEGTREAAHDAAREFLNIRDFVTNKTSKMCMEATEFIATEETEGRQSDDPAYPLVTKTYLTLQRDRRKHKPLVWSHSQHVHLRGIDLSQTRSDLQDDPDVTVLTFHDLVPMATRRHSVKPSDTHKVKVTKESYVRYQRADVAYWKGFTVGISQIPVASSCHGVYSLTVSPNHKMVAMGTIHGDILVYSLSLSPCRPLRAIRNREKGNDTIVDLAWSLDGRRLASTNSLGSLTLWSLSSGGVDRDDLRPLDLSATDSHKVTPSQLTHLVTLNSDHLDFIFRTGPLSELDLHTEGFGPSLVAFSPSITLLGSQTAVAIALDNGDILRCDFESEILGPLPKIMNSIDGQSQQEETDQSRPPSLAGREYDNPDLGGNGQARSNAPSRPLTQDDFDDGEQMEIPKIHQPKVYPPDGVLSTIGQEVPTELFRSHMYPIIHLGHVNNLEHMVSVDQRGYINVWRYSSRELGSYQWFIPYRKFRLDMNKLMYELASNAKPNIVFTDRKQRTTRKERTRHEIQRARQEAETLLEVIGLGDAWHEELLAEQKLLSRIFRPEGPVPPPGAVFHVVLRHTDTGLLSTYLTRVYRPVQIPASRLIACKQSIMGDCLHFLLLFPEFPPKGAHLTMVTFDLVTFEMTGYRSDILIETDALYEKCLRGDVVSFEVSPPLGMTGATYVFINIAGDLSAYSLVTGEKVLGVMDPRKPAAQTFRGCVVSSKTLDVSPSAQLAVTATNNKLMVFAYTSQQQQKQKYLSQVSVLELTDDNTADQRRAMDRARTLWSDKPPLPSASKRLDAKTYTLDNPYAPDNTIAAPNTHGGHHAHAYARLLLADLVGEVAGRGQGSDGGQDEVRASREEERVRAYGGIVDEVLAEQPFEFPDYHTRQPPQPPSERPTTDRGSVAYSRATVQ